MKKTDIYILLVAAAVFYFLDKANKQREQILIKEVPKKISGILENTF